MSAWGKNPASGLLLFAAGTTDSLAYFADLDDEIFARDWKVRGYPGDAIDIAHVRWATAGAISAVDVGAAVLGRLFLQPRKDGKEYDLGRIEKSTLEALRGGSSWAADWVSTVKEDDRYRPLAGVRDALIHRHHPRTVQLGGEGHAARLSLSLLGRDFTAREFVTLSCSFATDHVSELFDAVEKGTI